MPFKTKINKKAYDTLTDVQKELYKQDGVDYVLDIDTGSGGDGGTGDDDTTGLKNALDRERAARRKAQKQLAAINEKLEDVAEADARQKGDYDALKEAWDKKYTNDMAAKQKEIDTLTASVDTSKKTIANSLLDAEATKLANELSTSPNLMLPHIKSRLTVEVDDKTHQATVKVLGDDGKPSDTTMDDLKKSFVDNKDFASILVGTKASGGGAPSNGSSGSGSGEILKTDDGKPLDLANMPPKEFVAHMKAKHEAAAQES